ncbi:MAG: MFS transporter [Nitrospirae bacterium]|nr:MFS transporter [Nitrospirota bacterium]
MRSRLSPYLDVFRSRRIAVMLLIGFSSGLPLSLTGSTLQAWMTVAGVDLRTIGIFSLVGLPYTLKFLWSPFMDRFVPPWLGRRRGWIIIAQVCLVAGIAAMGFSSPNTAPLSLAILALIVAFTSASQDIVVDAYRTDVLRETERGVGAAVFVTGYRIAMLVSGAIALILSDRIGWQDTYIIMAGLMIVGILTTLWGPEPEDSIKHPETLQEAVWGPLRNFFSRPAAFSLLFLIVLYKLGDAYAGTMTTAFLIRGVGFTPTDVGTVNKGLGLVSLIIGAAFGGTMMVRLGLFRSLMAFGLLQAASNLSFILLAWTGKSYPVMIFAVAFENLTGGMGTAAFVSLLMALCDHRYSATQFALLSSLAALGRVFISPTSGYVVELTGWGTFFFITALTALPGLFLLWHMREDIAGLKQSKT